MGNVTSQPVGETIHNNSAGIIETFAEKYISIAKVDVTSGDTVVLKSDLDAELIGKTLPWVQLVERYAQRRVHPEDQEIVRNLQLDQLIAFYENRASVFPIELRCMGNGQDHDWVRLSCDVVVGESRQLLLMTKVVNDDHIMRKIVELYVYRNFDYFVLLDAKHNSYTMFSNQSGIPMPPSSGTDYEAEVMRFNQRYVVEEEEELVTAKMRIGHVQQMLETHDPYSFTAGTVMDDGEYRHTQISFTYYDKPAGLILLSRMDVTQMYLDEKKKERELAAALRTAQLDPMTELYNKRAMSELVCSALESQYRMQAAILFIDIDNFKLVNDTLGHQKGDELLCHLGRILAKLAGKNGFAGRIGGDEFLLYIPMVYDLTDIKQFAESICHSFQSGKDNDLGDLPISCSVGIAMYPRDGVRYENLLYKADQALYHAKRYGKCQYAFYSMEEEQKEEGNMENGMA